MKKRWIALLCLCVLPLAGCQALELLEQMRQESASSVSAQDAEHPESSAVETETGAPPQTSTPAPTRPGPAPKGAAEDIIRAAGPDDLMAVLQNPESATYGTLGEAAAEIDDFGHGDGAGHETVLIVPLQENVRITVEQTWLDYALNYMYPVETLGEFSGKPGEHLALNTFLAEGIPHARVVARLGERCAVWYCQYDGMGGSDVEYISAKASPEPISEFSSGVNMLSAAAATVAMLYAEEYQQLTPETLCALPDVYWSTVSYALVMYKESSEGDFDPGSGELMRAPAWLTDACRLALFPGTEDMSLYSQGLTVEREGDEYLINPAIIGEFTSWEHIASGSGADSETGYVEIAVTWPDNAPDPVTYRVEWAANDAVDLENPFQYHMTGIRVVKGP